LTALSACSSDNSPVEPGHTSPGPPVWSEITNLPAPVTLYGLWAPRPDYMIGVGRGGEIWQWDGQRWTQLPNSNPRNLNAIDGSTSGKVFAVGNGGTALEQVNGAFVARDLPVRNDLHDVWRSPSGQFCAVGDIGTVLRGDGTTWAQDSVATNAALLSVWGSSDTNIYAVSVDGDVLHFDGSTWKTAAHTPHMLTSIEGTGGTDVYAVGAGGTVLHYDGDAWTTLPSGTKDLLQACCASCGPAAAGANGSVAMWSNSAFTHQHINGAPWIYAMARAGSDTWAVGANALFRYDGATWALETRGTIPVLRGMTVTPSGNLMAAGDDGIVMNGSPSHWNIEDAGALQRVNAVWTSPAGDIFAAGTNRIFRRTANGWVTENSDIVEWYDIGGNSQHIFAVGKYGNIRERHGTTWSGVPGASYDLHAIRMDESGGYIVGDEGNILYYQAGGWGVKYTRAGVTFMDIEPVNTEQYRAIAVGSNGLSIGRSTAPAIGWTTMQTPVATTLYALARGPGGYLYAAGSSGTLLELVDEKWDLVPTPTSRTFYKLCEKDGALFLSGGDGAGGGVLFRYGSLNN
jgi:hypothetical protein